MAPHKEISWPEIYNLLCHNQRDKNYARKTNKSRKTAPPLPKAWSRHKFYRDMLNDHYTDGFIESTPFGRVIRQAQSSSFFRGEKEIYHTTRPSLFRKLNATNDPAEREVAAFVAKLRVADFLELILKFEHVHKFSSFDLAVLYEPLAQHYHFDTPFLDITSDFEVALFFACCKYEEHKWRPLTRDDFEKDENTRYGVIFKKEMWRHDSDLYWPDCDPLKMIWPIGFQPFNRCHMQSGYVLKMELHDDLQEDETFEIYKFRHTETICNLIYNHMDKGQKIYPHEGLNIMEMELEDLRKRWTFSRDTFNFVLKGEDNSDKQNIQDKLQKFGYKINEFPPKPFDQSKIDHLNFIYQNFDLEEEYGIILSTRQFYTPST